MSALLMLTGIALAYSGLGALSSTMDRHYAQLHGRGAEPSTRTRVQMTLLGASAIAASFAACIASDGWHLGPVLWFGALTASAIALTLLLHYAPRHALGLSIAAQTVALLCAGPGLMWR
jgi:hypothetical protein